MKTIRSHDVEDLKDEAVERLLQNIMSEFIGYISNGNSTDDANRYMLETLISGLDDLDNEDEFGTEGWRHTFGIEG